MYILLPSDIFEFDMYLDHLYSIATFERVSLSCKCWLYAQDETFVLHCEIPKYNKKDKIMLLSKKLNGIQC